MPAGRGKAARVSRRRLFEATAVRPSQPAKFALATSQFTTFQNAAM
jgi:hypothetical protein